MNKSNNIVGIIGSGMIGANVARLAVAAGIKVIICNSRGSETLTELVSELGDNACAATIDEVVTEANIIVVAIPFNKYTSLNPDILANKIVIDTMNYYPQRDGVMPEVKTDSIATSELIQRHLNKSRVVRALNNMDFVRLLSSARSMDSAERSALPIAGDDLAAKKDAAHFIEKIGYSTVDIGSLAESWRSEPTMPIYVVPYMKLENSITEPLSASDFASIPSRTVTIAEAKDLVERAVRHDKMFGDYLF